MKVRSANEEIILKSDLALMLFDLRASRGWTKKHLAEELGISPSALSKLESGQQFRLWERTWARIVEPLARLLDVSPEELEQMGGDLIAEVLVLQPARVDCACATLNEVLSADPRLDEAGKRFVLEAYHRAIGAV